MEIKVRLREHEYKLLKECFDEIAPDLNFRLDHVEPAFRAPGDDDCESNSTHIVRCETDKKRWNEIMDYCTGLEKTVYGPGDRQLVPDSDPLFQRYLKFDRCWSVMFYIADMYGFC